MHAALTGASRVVGMAAINAYRLSVRVRDKAFSVAIGHAFSAFGRRSVIQLPLRLSGERRISIGDDVFIGAGSWLQVLADESGPVVISVGDGTSIAGSCVLSAASSIALGEKVLIARNVYIADHMHRYDERSSAILDQGITRVARVEICDGAWLGQNVVVGPGVTIGRGAVIGANSVVLADVPDHSVAVGAPARVVKTFGGGL